MQEIGQFLAERLFPHQTLVKWPLILRPKLQILQKLYYFISTLATRDIKPGELILKDRPFAEGPGSKSPPVCLTCSKDAPTYRCSK